MRKTEQQAEQVKKIKKRNLYKLVPICFPLKKKKADIIWAMSEVSVESTYEIGSRKVKKQKKT